MSRKINSGCRAAMSGPGRKMAQGWLLAAVFAGCQLLVHSSWAQLNSAKNHVLEFDGQKSYMELPAGLFDHVEEITVEGWVKWHEFGSGARFFDFLVAGKMLWLENGRREPNLYLYALVDNRRGGDLVSTPDLLRLQEWYHIAAVSSKQAKQVFINGALVGEVNRQTPQGLSRWPLENFLGRSRWDASGTRDSYFVGQMDEVRVWKGARSQEQIRAGMFRRVSGDEEGLAGLWNFDDGTARDGSPGKHDGKLAGQLRIVPAELPKQVEPFRWSQLAVDFRDPDGKAVSNVRWQAQARGHTIGSSSGPWLKLPAGITNVDLVASDTNGLGGRRTGVTLIPHEIRTLRWQLEPAIDLAGAVRTMDGQFPMPGVLVELVKPKRDPHESQTNGSPPPPDVLTGPNPSLRFDASGSVLELPPGLLDNLTELTVEAWVKWDQYRPRGAALLSFGTNSYEFAVTLRRDSGTLRFMTSLNTFIDATDIIEPRRWHHVAAVAGAGIMRLYVNGRLVGTNTCPTPLFGGKEDRRAIIGDLNYANFAPAPDRTSALDGEVAELRIWKTARAEEQIRENLLKRLKGAEPELLGLWRFEDASEPGRDSASGRFRGQTLGALQVERALLPTVVQGQVLDPSGNPIPLAEVTVESASGERRVFRTNTAGDYAFTAHPGEMVDIEVHAGRLAAFRLGFQASGQPVQRLDWKLTDLRLQTDSSDVVQVTWTADDGAFRFLSVPFGTYQIRAHVPGGREWLDDGRWLQVRPDLRPAQQRGLRSLEFRIAPCSAGGWRQFTYEDGLLEPSVTGLASDSRGVLWILTPSGVLTYDGKSFENPAWPQNFSKAGIRTIYQGPDGTVWFGATDAIA